MWVELLHSVRPGHSLAHEETKRGSINVTDGISPWSHVGGSIGSVHVTRDGIFTSSRVSIGLTGTSHAFSTAISRTRGRCACLVEFLLMS